MARIAMVLLLLLVPSCLERQDEAGGRCDQQHPCPGSLRCLSGLCVDRHAGLGCETSADCPVGACHPTAHVCVACTEDAHCPAGVCHSEFSLCVACQEDADCVTLRCDTDNFICRGCRVDEQCPHGFCQEETGICLTPLD